MDLKEAYQIEAEELAIELYDKEYDDLIEIIQVLVYNEAIELVNEKLQLKADILIEELNMGK